MICGPGSFTGVRIGLATVKALAEVLSKPILAVTTFEAWAEKAPRWQGALVPLIDARRNEVYARVFERNGNCLIQRKPDWVGKPEKFLQTLDSKSILFLGDGAEKYDDLIRAEGPSSWEIAKTDFYLGRSLVSIVNSKLFQLSPITCEILFEDSSFFNSDNFFLFLKNFIPLILFIRIFFSYFKS